ncbi:hypothetical protein HYQ46_000521 [Verticillium longisporum]|nr:hypothetical protein HYQ46_000521 [Verticillium longisporum]
MCSLTLPSVAPSSARRTVEARALLEAVVEDRAASEEADFCSALILKASSVERLVPRKSCVSCDLTSREEVAATSWPPSASASAVDDRSRIQSSYGATAEVQASPS